MKVSTSESPGSSVQSSTTFVPSRIRLSHPLEQKVSVGNGMCHAMVVTPHKTVEGEEVLQCLGLRMASLYACSVVYQHEWRPNH